MALDLDVLAPAPDFRCVNLSRERVGTASVWATAAIAASFGVGAAQALGARAAMVVLGGAALAAAGGRAASRVRRGGLRTDWLSVHPWGVVVDDERSPRVLRWAAVDAVEVTTRYARDGGSTSAVWSRVTIETHHERLVGSTWGAVPLDRLQAHVRAYANEQARSLALDLDGRRPALDPFAPQAASLLSEARSWLHASDAVMRLGLAGGTYRRAAAPTATAEALEALAAVLDARSMPDRALDARAFAAVCAGELSATAMVPRLLPLTQSPHALVAAAARASALRLGADARRAGALEEIEPFLAPDDLATLSAWAVERPRAPL